ncbi:MAG TPA: erythromycin esterase family protein [bacterium]|nr:erythromycin esterase family protein [bacterium]
MHYGQLKKNAIVFNFDNFSKVFNNKFAAVIPNISIFAFGETLHSAEEILQIRNKIFQILVENYGFTAVAMECSFPHSKIINDYIHNNIDSTYQEIMDIGINNGFGRLKANQELIEWLKDYNSKKENFKKLNFYGFDIPGKNYGPAAPHFMIKQIFDYLKKYDAKIYKKYKDKISEYINSEEVWESYAALTDPTKAFGYTEQALKLQVEVKNIISEFKQKKFDFIAKSDKNQYSEILHLANILNEHIYYHTAIAQNAGYEFLLGYRDYLISENVNYIFNKEYERCATTKLFLFAHNAHLQKGKVYMPIGGKNCEWYPAGAYISDIFKTKYCMCGSAIGYCETYVETAPEISTFEKLFLDWHIPNFILATDEMIKNTDFSEFKTRTYSDKNPSYKPLSTQAFYDFDYICFFDKVNKSIAIN